MLFANQKGIAMLRIVLVCFSIFLASCTVSPLSGSNSGHSVGDGNIETHVSVFPTQAIQIAYGLNNNLDVGGFVEYGILSLSLEAWLKYALINEEQGHGLSLGGGGFLTGGILNSDGVYVSAIYSYRAQGFEPYIKLKLSKIEWDVEGLRKKRKENAENNGTNDLISSIILSSAENADNYFLMYGVGSRISLSDDSYIGLGLLGVKSKQVQSALVPEINFTMKF